MIEGLKPYAEYKESGSKWLGRVPCSWSLLPLCRVATPNSECGRTDLELLSVYLHRGVIRYSESGGQVHKPSTDLSRYQVVEPGDFVLNNQQAWRGSIGVSKYQGIISPAYVVMRLSPSILPDYANYMFRSPAMVAQYVVASRGVGDIQRNLYYPDLRCTIVVLPPPDEQAAIVRFLDHANRKIDGFIRAKRKLIGLLSEQKQAIIHRAVTRGLDPNVPLKPSGIPWLGDIPQHWEIVRNMALFAHRVEPGTENLPVLQVSLRSGITAEELDQFGRPKRLIADATKYKRIHRGDMAYNTMRMWQGAVGVSPGDGLVSPAYVVIKPRSDTCTEFYNLVFHTEVYKQQVNRQSTGIVSDRNRLYWDSFKQMPNLALPFKEQEEIVAFIAHETASLTAAIARTEREIALMLEYRTRLTADIVTGKLDVRAAAESLPEMPSDGSDMADLSEMSARSDESDFCEDPTLEDET